jgi:hypothetical protein
MKGRKRKFGRKGLKLEGKSKYWKRKKETEKEEKQKKKHIKNKRLRK